MNDKENAIRIKAKLETRTEDILNPNITEEFIPIISKMFELSEEPRIHYDGSEHYKSIMDDL